MKRFLLVSVFALAPSIGLMASAHADPVSIGYATSATGPITTIVSGNGTATVSSQTFGTFNINASGTGSPLLTQPTFDSSNLDINSGSAGTLYVYLTEQDLNGPLGGYNMQSSFTTNILQGANLSTTLATYYNPNNELYGTSNLLAAVTYTSGDQTSAITAVPALSSDYSLTQVYEVTFTGGGAVNSTIDMTDVPEPGSLALLGTGLLGLGLVIRRRKKHV